MFCENCGEKLNKEDKFCDKCGLKVENIINPKIKKSVFRKTLFWILIPIITIVVVYFIFSWLKPASKYNYRSVFIDNKTHSYQENEKFKYGQFSFQISSKTEAIPLIQEDCNKKVGSTKYDAWYKQEFPYACENQNNLNKNKSDWNKYISVNIKIKNDTNSTLSASKDWFTFINNNGRSYESTRANFETYGIMPDQEREGTLSEIMVNKNLQELNLTISQPRLAPQIVKLKLMNIE